MPLAGAENKPLRRSTSIPGSWTLFGSVEVTFALEG
jgi:hypothetical protein